MALKQKPIPVRQPLGYRAHTTSARKEKRVLGSKRQTKLVKKRQEVLRQK